MQNADLLLRHGADESIRDEDGLTPERRVRASLRDMYKRAPIRVAQAAHLRELIVRAPADRAWRRRGYLAMCRAHPGRMETPIVTPRRESTG